jgi:hypothetical protein
MTGTNLQPCLIGYAHVSTYGQTVDAQLEQLSAHGCAKVYREKASGARADRRELQRLLKDLAPGDMVTVTRDRSPTLLDAQSVRHCQNYRRYGRAIPLIGRGVGRQQRQHQPIEAALENQHRSIERGGYR